LNASYGGNFDLRTSADFATALFKHDIPALYCSRVVGLKIIRFETEWEEGLPDFFNHSIRCQYSSDVEIEGFIGRQAHLGDRRAAISLEGVSGATIRNCRASEGTTVFLQTSDLTDERLFVNNDLSSAQQAMEPAKSNFRDFGNYWPK
jgi:hypothetical protein